MPKNEVALAHSSHVHSSLLDCAGSFGHILVHTYPIHKNDNFLVLIRFSVRDPLQKYNELFELPAVGIRVEFSRPRIAVTNDEDVLVNRAIIKSLPWQLSAVPENLALFSDTNEIACRYESDRRIDEGCIQRAII